MQLDLIKHIKCFSLKFCFFLQLIEIRRTLFLVIKSKRASLIFTRSFRSLFFKLKAFHFLW